MPYVNDIEHVQYKVRTLHTPKRAGQLNYQVTSLVLAYLKENGTSYGTINAAIGVLECAKLELYRRIAAPYEDKKIAENGDVYP